MGKKKANSDYGPLKPTSLLKSHPCPLGAGGAGGGPVPAPWIRPGGAALHGNGTLWRERMRSWLCLPGCACLPPLLPVNAMAAESLRGILFVGTATAY